MTIVPPRIKPLPILTSVSLSEYQWQRIAVALQIAVNEYLRHVAIGDADSYFESGHWHTCADEARELCNRICDVATLDDAYRVGEMGNE